MFSSDVFRDGAPSGAYPFNYKDPRRVWNRCAGATAVGKHYRFDQANTIAVETTPNAAGELLPAVANMYAGPYKDQRASCWNNIIPVASGLSLMFGVYCLALEVAADNEPVLVLETGWTDKALVVHATAATYAAGSPLIVTNGGAALTIITSLSAATDTTARSVFRIVGFLTEPCTIAVNGTAVVAPGVFFNGFGINL